MAKAMACVCVCRAPACARELSAQSMGCVRGQFSGVAAFRFVSRRCACRFFIRWLRWQTRPFSIRLDERRVYFFIFNQTSHHHVIECVCLDII